MTLKKVYNSTPVQEYSPSKGLKLKLFEKKELTNLVTVILML